MQKRRQRQKEENETMNTVTTRELGRLINTYCMFWTKKMTKPAQVEAYTPLIKHDTKAKIKPTLIKYTTPTKKKTKTPFDT